MVDALNEFRALFVGWVKAHNEAKGYSSIPEELLEQLDRRIPLDLQRQIGAAFRNGWLKTDTRKGCGYVVRTANPEYTGVGLPAISGGKGGGRSGPWYEFYVQVADYSRLRLAADRRGLVVRLEDQLLDIAVWSGSSLLLYVENKVNSHDAIKLVEGMKKQGVEGVNLDAPDRNNDPLRKSKYLFAARGGPKFFAVSAIGHEAVYRVDYADAGNRFALTPVPGSVLDLILAHEGDGTSPARGGVDVLMATLDRLIGDRFWLSRGSRQTAMNVYALAAASDAIVAGVYANGEVWTNNRQFSPDRLASLSAELGRQGIRFEEAKGWCWWQTANGRFVLDLTNAEAVAEALADALG